MPSLIIDHEQGFAHERGFAQRIARLRRGDHLCLLPEDDAERIAAVVPFLERGLASAERCLYIADHHDCATAEESLARAGVAVGREKERGALVCLTASETYLRGGRFEPRAMVDLLRQAEQQALDDGFAGLRLAAEMSWAGDAAPGSDDPDPAARQALTDFEALLNRFLRGSRTIALCQYARRRFAPETLQQALRTHPLAVIGEQVCPNSFYEPPEMVLGRPTPAERVAWMSGHLQRTRASEQELEDLTRNLAQQRMALERADRSKEEFLAMLAHELRNPLATISSALQVMRIKGHGDETWKRAIEAAQRQVQHQASLVDDLLEAARVTRGEVELRWETIDLAALVREVVEPCREALRQAGLALSLRLADEFLPVRGDRARLGQALSNLLQNAIKFTARGGSIEIELARSAGGRRGIVTVRDSGAGIAPELLPHVFEVFTQADHSLDRSKGGLGVGLAVVKGLVELHGGEVQAASRGEGRGAEFSLLLPLDEVRLQASREAQHEPHVAGRRILVVEDNPDAGATLRDFLELYGFEVELASNGRAGIEAARQFHPEVVLCDLGLPEIDGFEVAARLRRDPATASARLIAVTGYGREEDRRKSKAAGFDLHLTKPVDPVQLRQMLQRGAA
jgi:signal transduction histidine kinase